MKPLLQWKFTFTFLAMAFAFAALTGGLVPFAAAQSDATRVVYESAATVQTNIAGIRTFPAPVADFKPLAASDEALARYGFPPRPDKQANPRGYMLWERAMMGARKRWTGELKPHPEAMSHPMMPAKRPASAPSTSEELIGSGTAVTQFSSNWSGVANTNSLTKWNAKTSFGSVYSQFNVPVVQQAFDVCDGGTDWEVTWNGIDGWKNGTVLQGGSSSQAYCKTILFETTTKQTYYAWIEWWPSYPIIEAFAVNPGDDIYVETYSPSGGCNPGFVFVEDETTLAYGTYTIDWQNGPCLVGNSAEIIAERPGTNTGLYPLANYIWDFALSWDYLLKGTENGPGATSASTYVIDMVDDKNTQVISYGIPEGKYSVWFYDTGCAYTGGCTP